ncbi:hypothetical protein PsorP6_005213 [Peronosclerospora sorghi]|uniref:Uncharacterized protein n=1 Tax=Peronosclerospora sorghi TaxID=230839 RepID=A0ACC0W0Y1_9STRA|nr:hypothetical protein PsorP6_005213 [Peronosclerospora sorghi]
MKTLFAAITMTLVYVSSLALADQSSDKVTTDMSMTDKMREHDTAELVVPVGIISNTIDAKDNKVLITKSNIVISKSDRLKLAKTIEEMLSTSSETHYSSMRSADNLMDLLTRIAATPDMFTHAARVADCTYNLVSVSSVTVHGVVVQFKQHRAVLQVGGAVVATVPKTGKLFEWRVGRDAREEANVAAGDPSVDTSVALWHARLGHVSGAKMKMVASACDGVP